MAIIPEHGTPERQRPLLPLRLWIFLAFVALFIPVIAILEYYVMTAEYERWFIPTQFLAGAGIALAFLPIQPRFTWWLFRTAAKLFFVFLFLLVLYHGTLFKSYEKFTPVAEIYGVAFVFVFLCKRRWRPWRSFFYWGLAWGIGIALAIAILSAIGKPDDAETYYHLTRRMAYDVIRPTSSVAFFLLILLGFLLSRQRQHRLLSTVVLFITFGLGLGYLGITRELQYWNDGWIREKSGVYYVDRYQWNPVEKPFSVCIDAPEYWQPVTVKTAAYFPYQTEQNLTPAKFGIHLWTLDPEKFFDAEPLFHTYADAFAYAHKKGYRLLPSASMLRFKADNLYENIRARLELHLQHDSKTLGRGRKALFRALLNQLAAMEESDTRNNAMAYLAAGLSLAGERFPQLPPEVDKERIPLQEAFLQDPVRSQSPMDYVDKEIVNGILLQNRFFQDGLSADATATLAKILIDHPDLREQYRNAVALNICFNNSPANFSPEDAAGYPEILNTPEALLAKLAEARKLENTAEQDPLKDSIQQSFGLLPCGIGRDRLFLDAQRALPENETSDQAMLCYIEAIRTGELDLTPWTDAGWLEYYGYALSAFAAPERTQEAEKLYFDPFYNHHLIDTYHVLTSPGSTRILRLRSREPEKLDWNNLLYPKEDLVIPISFGVEPVATYYLRTARAFAFLENALTQRLGQSELASILYDDTPPASEASENNAAIRSRPLSHPVKPRNVTDALEQGRMLFYGLYLRTCSDLGMQTAFDAGDLDENERPAALAAADAWLAGFERDPVFTVDVRSVKYSEQRAAPGRPVCRINAGIHLRQLRVRDDINCPPAIRVIDSERRFKTWGPNSEDKDWFNELDIHFGFSAPMYSAPVEIFAEADGPATPLTLQEFRALCDKYNTRDEIAAALAIYGSWQRKAKTILFVIALFAVCIVAFLFLRRSTYSHPLRNPQRRTGT